VLARRLDVFHPAPVAGRDLLVLQDQLREAEHGVQRRPELMAQARQQLGLGSGGRLGPLAQAVGLVPLLLRQLGLHARGAVHEGHKGHRVAAAALGRCGQPTQAEVHPPRQARGHTQLHLVQDDGWPDTRRGPQPAQGAGQPMLLLRVRAQPAQRDAHGAGHVLQAQRFDGLLVGLQHHPAAVHQQRRHRQLPEQAPQPGHGLLHPLQ
jgi:hypothetical protein